MRKLPQPPHSTFETTCFVPGIMFRGTGGIFSFAICLALLLCGCQFPGFGTRGSGTTDHAPAKNPCIVLALPASGPFAGTAAKIKKGASIAQKELKTTGIDLRLENINTEASDWITQLEALPPMCQVVGGPLQDKKFMAARKAGLLEKKIFFVFTPGLQQGDEGKIAWRFFPSQQDQIDALTHFATDEMNIHTYGAFYPSDTYGQRMVSLLEKTLSKRHIPLKKASYNSSAPATWTDAAKPLVDPVQSEGKNSPVPRTAFEALFVPDSWKHLDLVTSSLLYHGEDRLVILGPMLWEQSLSGKKITKPEKYELAVFPAAWNAARAPKSLSGAGNDFWVALGFDFANFAVNTGLAERLPAQEVLRRVQRASATIRGMAPISWNNDGIASQHLYIFQVTGNGVKPVNPEEFRQTRSAVLERSALRMQGLESNREPVDDDAAATPESAGTQSQPASSGMETPVATQPAISAPQPRPAPEQPVLSTVPQPSYKLRLPVKK